MQHFICAYCGTQYAASEAPPSECPICLDERKAGCPQPPDWTTLGEMTAHGYRNELRTLDQGLTSIRTTPGFAIGQRAILIQTAAGNVLWDCVSYIDDDTVQKLRAMGGIAAVAISHPHYYASMAQWSGALGSVPIYICGADRQWIMRPDPMIRLWEGHLELMPGLTLVQCGGHFDGSAVLHWASGAAGLGVLLASDTMLITGHGANIGFMRSYCNYIPLPPAAIRHIATMIKHYRFERIYGPCLHSVIPQGGSSAVERSIARYIARVQD